MMLILRRNAKQAAAQRETYNEDEGMHRDLWSTENTEYSVLSSSILL